MISDTVPQDRPEPGQTVVLLTVPPGLVRGLPARDRRAIEAIVGRPVLLVEYDDLDRAELEFLDDRGINHSIWVAPHFIRKATDDDGPRLNWPAS